jgi:hypothetical protein
MTGEMDYVRTAFDKIKAARNKIENADRTPFPVAERREALHDIDEATDMLETWLKDRDYVESIP